MSIRRKSTTHDLATLRLHPDGSRVQQSSANSRQRTAKSTVVDSRGNWIAKDAGGKGSVKKRRSLHTDDTGGDFIDLSDEENTEETRHLSKGKQQARDGQDSFQDQALENLNTRTRQRISFTRDLSFLDPPPLGVSSLEQDYVTSFQDPAPDLLKSIHHFASCYFSERGQLFDSSRNFRGKKKERHKQSRENVHTLTSNTREHQDSDTDAEQTEMEDENTEEDEEESEIIHAEGNGRENAKAKADTYRKDMYKAFDGSALMAIGIVMQEYVAHALSSKRRTMEEPHSPKRRKTE